MALVGAPVAMAGRVDVDAHVGVAEISVAQSTSEAIILPASEPDDRPSVPDDTEAFVVRIARQIGSMRPLAEDGHARVDASHVSFHARGWPFHVESRQRIAARTSAVAVRIMMRTYGSSLRARGVPPEQFVPPLRTVLQRAVALAAIEAERARWIVRSGVLWGIEGYYNQSG